MTLHQVLITLDDGRQVLVDRFDSGEVEVSVRPEPDPSVLWVPAELANATVEVSEYAG